MARRAVLLALTSAPAALADLPVHCLHSQIQGEWTFSLGPAAPSHHAIPNCSATFEPTMTVKVALGRDKPGAALVTEASSGAPVSVGDEGTWTTIYDEGFEVRVGGQHFFAFSKYNRGLARSYAREARAARHSAASAASSKYSTELLQTMPSGDDLDTALRLSQCDQTFPGEYHSAAIENWGCYHAAKTNSAPARCRGAACASWMSATSSPPSCWAPSKGWVRCLRSCGAADVYHFYFFATCTAVPQDTGLARAMGVMLCVHIAT